MATLSFVFFFLTAIFAVIGSLRGWAKEMMVTFSVILAVFIIYIMQGIIPGLLNSLTPAGTAAYFWLRAGILIILVFFGYQTPNLPKIGGARFARERLQDILLGLFLGAMNGFLVAGALWFYMKEAGYPFPQYILPPVQGDPFTDSAYRLYPWLAPEWLTGNMLYIAVALAFVFVIVVFL
jgi:hypothetical protein